MVLQTRDLWNSLCQDVADAEFLSSFWWTPREVREGHRGGTGHGVLNRQKQHLAEETSEVPVAGC